jgi:DNA adenine methylase
VPKQSKPVTHPYKIRRKIPDPKWNASGFLRARKRKSSEQAALKDEQLALSAVSQAVPEEAQPFLKWVGGKAQLIRQFDNFFPAQIDRYFEPFIGGGAVFFHLRHRFPKMRGFLRDINPELINAYRAVQKSPRELMRRLDEHSACFRADREKYFYLTRAEHHLPPTAVVERAARMIFLNKTCFNGLWRVNARGEFNVPIGSHKAPNLYDEENILMASQALQGVDLAVQDFRDTLRETEEGDFVYIDPPYYPISATASFTSYAKEDFGPEEQHELAAVFADAAQRGVRVMLSNSDTPFIRKLYRDFQIHTVQARRAINCDGSKRGHINEVVIVGLKEKKL